MPDPHEPREALPSQHSANNADPSIIAAAYRACEGVDATLYLADYIHYNFYLPSLMDATCVAPGFSFTFRWCQSAQLPPDTHRGPSSRQ